MGSPVSAESGGKVQSRMQVEGQVEGCRLNVGPSPLLICLQHPNYLLLVPSLPPGQRLQDSSLEKGKGPKDIKFQTLETPTQGSGQKHELRLLQKDGLRKRVEAYCCWKLNRRNVCKCKNRSSTRPEFQEARGSHLLGDVLKSRCNT